MIRAAGEPKPPERAASYGEIPTPHRVIAGNRQEVEVLRRLGEPVTRWRVQKETGIPLGYRDRKAAIGVAEGVARLDVKILDADVRTHLRAATGAPVFSSRTKPVM